MMRRSFLLLLALGAPLATGLISGIGRADSPLPPPARQTIWSNNRRFFAVTDPKDWITTIYRATPDGKGIKSWAMIGYLRSAWLADDGEHLAADPLGLGGLVPLDYDKGQVVLYFFRRGELINTVTVGQVQVIGNFSKLVRTASHYSWGHPVGFDQDGYFVIETLEVENRAFKAIPAFRAIRFDASKGKPLIDAHSK
jgi:hypothetical protein